MIGNGFDIHHGMKTNLKYFKDYIKSNDQQIFDWAEKYIPTGDDWSDLELALADLDTENLLIDLSEHLTSYSDENWSDSGNHNFQYEVNQVASGLSENLRDRFSDWIRSTPVPKNIHKDTLLKTLNKDSYYLNFNYTNTLTELYNIPSESILHIHGEALDNNCDLILGHAWDTESRALLHESSNGESSDHRVEEALHILDSYFEKTFKPSKRIIESYSYFFNNLKTVSHIYIRPLTFSSR